MFYNLAKLLKIPFYILNCQTTDLELIQRIKKRDIKKNTISEANSSILEYQKRLIEPLSSSEKLHTLVIDGKMSTFKNVLDSICSYKNYFKFSIYTRLN